MKTKIVLIGAGNVGHHLGNELCNKGFRVLQVFSRKRHKAARLAQLLNCSSTISLNRINKQADLYIIAVSDDAIQEVVNKLSLPADKLVVHTSGSVQADTIIDKFPHGGVFYPLQTFSKRVDVRFSEIPICVYSNDQESLKTLKKVGSRLSRRVEEINDSQRKTLHLAAVFANNFSNHIFTMAQDIVESDDLDFSILHPLMKETVRKSIEVGPDEGQTGPAMRADSRIISSHLKELRTHPDFKKVYKILTESILKYYGS